MPVIELYLESLDLNCARLRASDRRAENRLLASLGEEGQQSPIVVVGCGEGGHVVIDGCKRVRALRRLHADVVKAMVWDMPVHEALVNMYRLQAQGGRNAVEEGWLVAELSGSWGLGEIAKRLNRSKSWVSRRLGLAEGLPEAVAAGVKSGAIGAWAAAKYLLPLARANADLCAKLAEKIVGAGLSSRQIGLICGHLAKSKSETRWRILEDPVRFLKALEASIGGADDITLAEPESRALKQLTLIGNVALGLARSMPGILGYDAPDGARLKLLTAWKSSCRRLALLAETLAALESARMKPKEEAYAEPGIANGDNNAARAGAREPEDIGGPGCEPEQRPGGDSQRADAGKAQSAGASFGRVA